MRAAGGGSDAGGREPDEDAVWIERARIEPNPAQPRRTWSDETLRELGDSLRRDGQLQACVVRPHPGRAGFYQLISGERRWRASGPGFADLPRLRCTIRAVDDDQSLRLALVENLQREDLNDIDKARAFVDLRDSLAKSDPRVTWAQVGQAVGLSREYLARLKALLDLPEEVQQAVRGGALSGRSARALSGLRDADAQKQLALEIQRDKLSSDQALDRVRALTRPRSSGRANPARVTRGSQNPEAPVLEEPLREAVRLLALARRGAGAAKKSKQAQRLIAQAREHIEALADEGH
jgi:ParB family chromosome partitioning protein